MTKTTIRHDHTATEAKSRLSSQVGSYAREYGLSGRWSGTTWSGKRKGVSVSAVVGDKSIQLTVDTSWYVPVSEGRIISGIKQALRELL